MTHEQILDLIRRWAEAELHADVAALDALLAADFIGVGPRGFVLKRQQWLDRYRSGDLRNDAFSLQDVSMRDYGEAAVAVGIQDQCTTFQGHNASGQFRVSLVFVRQAGCWLIAGWQASGPIPDVPPGRG